MPPAHPNTITLSVKPAQAQAQIMLLKPIVLLALATSAAAAWGDRCNHPKGDGMSTSPTVADVRRLRDDRQLQQDRRHACPRQMPQRPEQHSVLLQVRLQVPGRVRQVLQEDLGQVPGR